MYGEEETSPTNPAYENFITQAQGRLQDRPFTPRVNEDEVIFIDQAIAELRTLREKVNSLESETQERDLELIAVFEKLDKREKQRRSSCE